MSELEHDPAIEAEPAELSSNVTPIGPNPSYIDLLRQEYQELIDSEDVMIPIMGFERVGLRAKYRMPESGKELDNIARRVAREFKDNFSRNLYTAIDTMIILCEGMYVLPIAELDLEGNPTEPQPLDPENMGEPARYDQKLAEIMGFTGTNSAREVVRKLFGKNDMAIVSHAEKLSRWLTNTKADLNVEFWQLGEGI
jgi:hypothetical protein